MQFYIKWKECFGNNDNYFWNSFLNNTEESINVFLNGTSSEIIEVISFLNLIPIEYFVEHVINLTKIYNIVSSSIPQFSSFSDGTIEVCKKLLSNGDLSFTELGKLFNKKPTFFAWQKYGSEQGRLSNIYLLSQLIKKDKSRTVFLKITNFGKLFIDLSEYDRKETLKRLSYRFDFFQLIIQNLKKYKNVELDNIMPNISQETKKRRKSNVFVILDLMFNDNSYSFWLKHIK